MKMMITTSQAQQLLAARKMIPYARKDAKKRIFAAIKAEHGIPRTTKLRLYIENPQNELYCVLRDKRTGQALDNGIPDAKPVKAAAKKAPVKVAAKKVVKAPTKAPTKTPVKAPTTSTYPKELRVTINGKRVRLGTAKDAKHEAKLIAAYKKA